MYLRRFGLIKHAFQGLSKRFKLVIVFLFGLLFLSFGLAAYSEEQEIVVNESTLDFANSTQSMKIDYKTLIAEDQSLEYINDVRLTDIYFLGKKNEHHILFEFITIEDKDINLTTSVEQLKNNQEVQDPIQRFINLGELQQEIIVNDVLNEKGLSFNLFVKEIAENEYTITSEDNNAVIAVNPDSTIHWNDFLEYIELAEKNALRDATKEERIRVASGMVKQIVRDNRDKNSGFFRLADNTELPNNILNFFVNWKLEGEGIKLKNNKVINNSRGKLSKIYAELIDPDNGEPVTIQVTEKDTNLLINSGLTKRRNK